MKNTFQPSVFQLFQGWPRKQLGLLAWTFCLLLLFPASLQAGDPIPGIDVSIEQVPGGSITVQFNGNVLFNGLVGNAIGVQGTNALYGVVTNASVQLTGGTVPGNQMVILQANGTNDFSGLTYTALGSATVNVASNQMVVGNLGSSGEDGIVISNPCPDGCPFTLNLQPVDLSGVGAQMTMATVGQVGGASGVTAGSLSLSNNAQGQLRLRSDFSGVGATQVVVTVYSGGVAVGSAVMADGDLGDLSPLVQSYGVSIQTGLNIIANQVDHGSNDLNSVIATAPDGCTLYKFNNSRSNWEESVYDAALGTWVPDDITLHPGEGAFLQSPTNFTLTFTGTPHVPLLPVSIPAGACYLLSRQTNAIGNYTNIVGSAPPARAEWFQWSSASQSYTSYTRGSVGWLPSEPTAAVGEAVWIAPAGGSPASFPTNSFQVYQGLLNESLGSATFSLNAQSNQLTVGNLGSSGQDGVSITLPEDLTALVLHYEALDASNTLPVGAYIEERMVGTANGITNGVLGTVTETKAGTSNYVISADFSPVGASAYTVQAYYQGALVAQATNQSGASLAVAQNAARDEDVVVPAPELPDGYMSVDGITPVMIAGQEVTCDHLYVIPDKVSLPSSVTAFQIVASQIPTLTIDSENTSLEYQGLTNTSLGHASMFRRRRHQYHSHYDTDGDFDSDDALIVANPGTNGQDGVSITVPDDQLRVQPHVWVGFVVHNDPLDASNTLPVGAYVQSQAIGTANGITNGVLGTLTETKAGTSNYVISADYSPLGASNFTVQVYYQGVLMAQSTNQNGASFATVNRLGRGKDLGDIITPLSDEWPGAPGADLTLAGVTTSVPCDHLVVAPDNLTFAAAPTAFQIVASQIPSITITSENESLVYQGLTNTSLGQASIAIKSQGEGVKLTVADLGTNGQNGVSIALPSDLTGLDVGWDDLDPSNALPVGAYVQSQLVGTDNGITNGVLGTLTETKEGTSNYVISADFSPVGAKTYAVQAYYQGVMVAQATNQSGASLVVANKAAVTAGPPAFDAYISLDGPGTSVSVAGQVVTCDHLYVTPENVPLPSAVTAFQIVASQIPAITITSENASLPYAGLAYNSLGSATLNVSSNQLTVSNIGSSGQDGLSIALPSSLTELETEWQPLDPSNTLPVGAYIQGQVIGTANGVTNGVLGTITATKAGTSNYVISADFSAVGASTYTLQAYYQGALVAEETNQPGPQLADSSGWPTDIYIDITDFEKTLFGPSWDNGATTLSLVGSNVTCDHLRIIPENVTWPSSPTALRIVASQVPSFTITSVAPKPLNINLSGTGQNILLQWYGTSVLQKSTNLVDWTDVTNASTPYNIHPANPNAPVKFYRLVFRP